MSEMVRSVNLALEQLAILVEKGAISVAELPIWLRSLANKLVEQPTTLGADEPHPGGTPHARWQEYERRVATEACGSYKTGQHQSGGSIPGAPYGGRFR